MSIRYIQTAVSQDLYDKVARCAFDEKLTLSDLLTKAIISYLERKEVQSASSLKEEK
jgi:hypothetical protein